MSIHWLSDQFLKYALDAKLCRNGVVCVVCIINSQQLTQGNRYELSSVSCELLIRNKLHKEIGMG